MKRTFVFYCGILGVLFFLVTSLLGGYLIEDYNILKHYISETYAIDTQYGWALRMYGYIPSGILIALFCFLSINYFKTSKWAKIGFYSIGVFYGLATIVVSIFPCDSGCNREFINPSTSQIIHNFIGALTYLFVPLSIILVGIGLKRVEPSQFANRSILLGGSSVLFVSVLMMNANSEYVGLYQRMVESAFLVWIVLCALTIKNKAAVTKKI